LARPGFFLCGKRSPECQRISRECNGIKRPPFIETQPGALVSGPLIRNRLFLFTAFQARYSHGRGDPQFFGLPTASFINSTDAGSYAGQLLRRYRPESQPVTAGDIARVAIAPVTAFHRADALARVDYTLSTANQMFARATIDRIDQPELLFNPYRDLSTPFYQRSLSLAVDSFEIGSGQPERVSRRPDRGFHSTGNATRRDPRLVDDELIQAGDQRFRILLPGNQSQNKLSQQRQKLELLDNWT